MGKKGKVCVNGVWKKWEEITGKVNCEKRKNVNENMNNVENEAGRGDDIARASKNINKFLDEARGELRLIISL